MPEFKDYSTPGSPFGRAVLATLEEKSAVWRLIAVMPGTFRSPENLARNPFGRVPAIEHDGFGLYETQAILRYIDRIAPGVALTPADPRAAARMDQAMNIADWYLFQGVANVIGFQRVVAPRLLGRAPDEQAIVDALPAARTVLAEFARLLGDAPWLAGATISLADLIAAAHIDFLADTPEWSLLSAPHGNLVAWLERMKARQSIQATTWERVATLAAA